MEKVSNSIEKKEEQMRSLKGKSRSIRGVVLGVVAVCVFCSAVNGAPWGGSGVEGDPYLIYDACDMQAIGADSNYWDAHFKLMADIDLSAYTGMSFNMIGLYSFRPFTGVFDGNGHTISNFSYSTTGINRIGLFSYVSNSNAEIRNLGLIDPNINAGTAETAEYIGSLVGYVYDGNIINCYVDGGRVLGDDYVGGLIGISEGNISNSHATSTVIGDFTVGGLVGKNDGDIQNCYATGPITGSDEVGGLIGCNFFEGTISDSFATCNIDGEGCIGGLAGHNRGDISGCSAKGNVSGDSDIGGLVGNNWGNISDCHATGDVSGNTYGSGGLTGRDEGGEISKCYYINGIIDGNESVGGLVGWANSTSITDCYSDSNTLGYEYVGGLVGYIIYGEISNCYSISIVRGIDLTGGLVGYNSFADVFDCFWDVNSSGQSSSAGGTGKTTMEMQTRGTFTDAGWDFVEIWDIGENQTYPFLRTYLPSDINKDKETNFYDLAILASHWLEGD